MFVLFILARVVVVLSYFRRGKKEEKDNFENNSPVHSYRAHRFFSRVAVKHEMK